MLSFKHTITPKLLHHIKEITLLVHELNGFNLPGLVLVEFENKANSLSAHTSTSIEGNPLPLTEVKKLIKSRPQNIRDTEREVLNYNQALVDLNALIHETKIKFTLNFILDIHKKIMMKLLPSFHCGKLRKEPVFVNDPRSGKTLYWPPDHDDLPKLMGGLLSFIQHNRNKIDPILLAGLFHKQFVLIHPFVDGNGRTTRLLTKALLADMGLNTFSLFSFENYYNKNVSRYFQMVGARGNFYDLITDIDFSDWLEYFTDGIIDELLRVKKEIQNVQITPQNTLKKYHRSLLEYIKKHGFITDFDYAKLTERAKATRALDFKKLIEMEFIEKHGRGKNTHYKMKN